MIAAILSCALVILSSIQNGSAGVDGSHRTTLDASRDLTARTVTGRAYPSSAGGGDIERFDSYVAAGALRMTSVVDRWPRRNWANIWRVRVSGANYVITVAKPAPSRPLIVTMLRNGQRINCESGISHSEVGTAHAVSLPLDCLGNPTWVETGAIVVSDRGPLTLSDDALVEGHSSETHCTVGPRQAARG